MHVRPRDKPGWHANGSWKHGMGQRVREERNLGPVVREIRRQMRLDWGSPAEDMEI